MSAGSADLSKLPGFDRWYWSNHRGISVALNAWIIIGELYYIAVMFYTHPWTPDLGVAGSPMRQIVSFTVMLVQVLPVAFWLMKYWIDHQEWVAEANGEDYVPGRYYPVFTTKRIITSAIGMAMFGSSGAFWSPVLDVPGLIWQFLAIAYDPVVCWFAVSFGFLLIRGPLFAGIWSPFTLTNVAVQDAPMLLFVANIWWRYWRPRYLKGQMSLFLVAVEYTILGLFIHWPTGGWNANDTRFALPDPAYLAEIVGWSINPWQWIQFGGFKFIGVFVGAAVGRYTWMKKPEYVRLK